MRASRLRDGWNEGRDAGEADWIPRRPAVPAAPRVAVARQATWIVVGFSALCVLRAPGARLALAHAELVSSTPAAGETVAEPPPEVVLAFSDALAPGSRLDVLDDAFRSVVAGSTAFDPSEPTAMRAALRPLGPGDYTVQYRAVEHGDGHVVEGSLAFRVAAPADPAQLEARPTHGAIEAGVAAPGLADSTTEAGAVATGRAESPSVAVATAADARTPAGSSERGPDGAPRRSTAGAIGLAAAVVALAAAARARSRRRR